MIQKPLLYGTKEVNLILLITYATLIFFREQSHLCDKCKDMLNMHVHLFAIQFLYGPSDLNLNVAKHLK